ncbi:hypothetical protein [Streptomyces sp. NPDC051776]
MGTEVTGIGPVGSRSVTDGVTRGRSMDDAQLLEPVAQKLPGGSAR